MKTKRLICYFVLDEYLYFLKLCVLQC